MRNKLNQTHWLWILLGGGIMFVLAAVGVVGALLWTSDRPAPKSVAIVTATAPASAVATDTATLSTAESTAMPTDTSIPPADTPTSTPKPVSGDKLTLPTATRTPRPTSTATRTPTVTPTRTPIATPVPGQSEGLGVGNIAPDFTVGNTRASRVSLSTLRGKVVVLNFWTTWCPSCRREIPDLQAVHNEYGPQGVVVLAVNVKEKVDTVARYANDNGISFNVWLDEDGWVSTIYGIRAIPTTYFIDEQGIIRAVHFGAMNREQITVQVQKLL